MKACFILLVVAASCSIAKAQFPAPTDFSFSYQYNNTGEVLCNGADIPLYAYCSHFNWRAPDTAGIPATLVSYTVIWDNYPVSTVPDTSLAVVQGFMGNMWVIANYVDPDGSSDPSNIVHNKGLPITVQEVAKPAVQVWPNIFDEFIAVRPIDPAPLQLKILDMQGRPVYERSFAGETRMDLKELAGGSYTAFLWQGGKLINRVQLMKQ